MPPVALGLLLGLVHPAMAKQSGSQKSQVRHSRTYQSTMQDVLAPAAPGPGSSAAGSLPPGPKPHGTSLSFRQALGLAWDRLPEQQTFQAQQRSAAAQYAAGGALFPNAPSVTGTFVNDNIAGSANDYITNQVEFSTPVWLPGEGTATQHSARALGTAARASAEAAHLDLAMRLLTLTAQATLAANSREVAERRLAAARTLDRDAANRFHTGEGSQSDALAADAQAAGAQINLSDAEAQLAEARATLTAVLGQDTIPSLAGSASLPTGTDVQQQHPRIVAATRAVAAAEAQRRLVQIQNRDSPEVGVQGVNEKQPGTPWDTRFGVVVRFSFATEARNAPRRAAAEERVTQAQVQLENARRQVMIEYRQASAVLAAAITSEVAARRVAEAEARRQGMVERAWRLGEMPLIEVVRAYALSFDARLAQVKSRTSLDAARLRLLLASGVLP